MNNYTTISVKPETKQLFESNKTFRETNDECLNRLIEINRIHMETARLASMTQNFNVVDKIGRK